MLLIIDPLSTDNKTYFKKGTGMTRSKAEALQVRNVEEGINAIRGRTEYLPTFEEVVGSYVLVQVKRDGNGVRDERTQIAVSDTEQKLVDYCNTELGMGIGEPKKYSWADYYLIETSNIKIV